MARGGHGVVVTRERVGRGGAFVEPEQLAAAWTLGLSTFGGYGLYWLNLRRRTVTQLSSLLYLTPPVTLLWALAMFGQPITSSTIAGLAVCLAGVLLARDGASRHHPPAQRDREQTSGISCVRADLRLRVPGVWRAL